MYRKHSKIVYCIKYIKQEFNSIKYIFPLEEIIYTPKPLEGAEFSKSRKG